MIDETDRYWGGSSGRNWGELPGMMRQLKLPIMRRSETAFANDRIPQHEVAEAMRSWAGSDYAPATAPMAAPI